MEIRWSLVLATANGQTRPWAVLPSRCAGVVALDLQVVSSSVQTNQGIDPGMQVAERGSIPEDRRSRKVGNQGAHHTDERLEAPEVERALRFTTQVLRNLFEVPGELTELEAEVPATPDE